MRVLALAVLASFSLAAPARVDVALCQWAYEDLSGPGAPPDSPFINFEGAENAEARDFFLSVLIPVVGMRALRKGPSGYRSCSVSGGCLSIGRGTSGPALKVVWTTHGNKPRIDNSAPGSRTLFIPKGYDFSALPDRGEGLVKRFLTGHELHPNLSDENIILERIQLGEDGIHLKEIQEQGRDAAVDAIERGDESFLYVAPTGGGKSIVAEEVLSHQVARNEALRKSAKASERKKARKLHVVVADKNFLVKQLAKDVAPVESEHPPRIIEWRSNHTPNKGDPTTLDELMLQVDDYDGPTILVTNIRSLIDRTKDGDNKNLYDANLTEVRSRLGTVVFDEAHHAGAKESETFLKEVLDRKKGSRAFLYGTTATPTHRETDLIQSVFGKRAFWAYLDTPEDYRSPDRTLDRDIKQIVKQLGAGIEQGELNPFVPHWIDPLRFEDITGMKLFESSKHLEALAKGEEDPESMKGNRFVLNPLQYGNIINRLDPLMKRHEQGFIVAADITEARDFTGALKAKYGDMVPGPNGEQMFAALHSDLSDAEKNKIMEDYRTGKIRFLVTVRMLDEGINVPKMSLYVDLTHDPPGKQLIQRIGRVLRITESKNGPSEVVTFRDIHDEETANALAELDNIADHGSGGGEPGGPIPHNRGYPALFEDVRWTEAEIAAAKRVFFTDSDRGVSKARADAQRLIRFFESEDRELDGIGNVRVNRISSADSLLNIAERTLHEALATRLDSSRTNAPSNIAFFDALAASGSKKVAEGVEIFKKKRSERRERMRTPEGVADVLAEFIRLNKRTPRAHDVDGGGKPTTDEVEISSYVHDNRYDLGFLMELEKRVPRNSASATLFRNYLDSAVSEMDNPEAVAAWVDQFWKINKRLPSAKTAGLEGHLAKAMESVGNLDSVLKDEDAAFAVLEQREATAERKAEAPKKTLAPGRMPPAVVPVGKNAPANLQTALRDRILNALSAKISAYGKTYPPERSRLEALRDKYREHYEAEKNYEAAVAKKDKKTADDAAALLADLNTELSRTENLTPLIPTSSHNVRPKAKAGRSPETATLTLSGAGGGVRALADFYIASAKELGFKVDESTGVKGQIVLRVQGEGAITTFELERSVQHSVQFFERGRTYTNIAEVRVVELGNDPLPADAARRSYRLQNKKPAISQTGVGSFETSSPAGTLQSLYEALRLKEIEMTYPQ